MDPRSSLLALIATVGADVAAQLLTSVSPLNAADVARVVLVIDAAVAAVDPSAALDAAKAAINGGN
jgi:hypothetical protein